MQATGFAQSEARKRTFRRSQIFDAVPSCLRLRPERSVRDGTSITVTFTNKSNYMPQVVAPSDLSPLVVASSDSRKFTASRNAATPYAARANVPPRERRALLRFKEEDVDSVLEKVVDVMLMPLSRLKSFIAVQYKTSEIKYLIEKLDSRYSIWKYKGRRAIKPWGKPPHFLNKGVLFIFSKIKDALITLGIVVF